MYNTIIIKVYLIFYCIIYLLIGASSEMVGDYHVYIEMYRNGFLEGFDNQPIFSIYLEALRNLIPYSKLFFIIAALPFLYFSISVEKNSKINVSATIILTVLLPLIVSPESFFYLFRQNLGLIVLQSIMHYSTFWGFIIASGFHYSFIILFGLFIFYNYLFSTIGLKKIILKILLTYILLYFASKYLFAIIESITGYDNSVVSTYSTLYLDYNDAFPGISNLYIFSIGSVLIYFSFLDRLDIKNIRNNAILVVSVLAVAIFCNQSDPLQYRYLQVAKISAAIIYAYFIYFLILKLKNY